MSCNCPHEINPVAFERQHRHTNVGNVYVPLISKLHTCSYSYVSPRHSMGGSAPHKNLFVQNDFCSVQNDYEKQLSWLYRLQIDGELSITIPVPFWILWGARTPQKLGKYIEKLVFFIKIAQFWATEISPDFFHIIRPRRIRFFRSQGRFIRKKHGFKGSERGQNRGCAPPLYSPL